MKSSLKRVILASWKFISNQVVTKYINATICVYCSYTPANRNRYLMDKCEKNESVTSEEDNTEDVKNEKNAVVKLVAVFLTLCAIGAFSYSSGIIHKILLERYDASVGLTSWAGALLSALMMVPGMTSYITKQN